MGLRQIIIATGAISMCCASSLFADAYDVSGLFVRGQVMYNHTMTLSVAEPNFYTNFGVSNGNVYSQLWAVAGQAGNASGPGSGVAQVSRAIDPWYHDQLHVGESYQSSGTVIYHFVSAKGQSFSGGNVTVNVDYRGDAASMFVSTSSVMPTGSGSPNWSTFNWTAYQTKLFDQFNTRVNYSVATPAGKEFWVAISKPLTTDPSTRSVYAQVMSLNVATTVTQSCTALAADLNNDCDVNFKDFALIGANWLKCSDADNPQGCPGIYGPDGWEI